VVGVTIIVGTDLRIDESSRNADWLKVVALGRELAQWPAERIDSECRSAYVGYHEAVRARHVAFFADRPDECEPGHTFVAADLASALPPDRAELGRVVPPGLWHRHCRSGGSSQTLAVALLGTAARQAGTLPLFEVQLASHVLNERPRQTTLDWLSLGRNSVVVGEAKFTEQGFGTCSCRNGRCSEPVLDRPYWDVAVGELGLDRAATPCVLATAYQVVRNVAAAIVLAGERKATFALFYDRRNPYFSGSGAWKGWVPTLVGLMRHSRVSFMPVSWQELVARVPADVAHWAREKHGIEPA
jgi:hypothetical protein